MIIKMLSSSNRNIEVRIKNKTIEINSFLEKFILKSFDKIKRRAIICNILNIKYLINIMLKTLMLRLNSFVFKEKETNSKSKKLINELNNENQPKDLNLFVAPSLVVKS